METRPLVDYERFKSIQAALLLSFQNQTDSPYFKYSRMWKGEVAHRDTANDLSDYLVTLSDRFTYKSGITGSLPETKKKVVYDYYRSLLDNNLLAQYPMPWLGSPSVMDFDGRPACVPYLENLRLFSDVQTILGKAGVLARSRPLHIVEIGAGYGGLAYFLLKSGIAATYTIVDLPDNLKLSAFFLTQNFQELPCTVLSSSKKVSQKQGQSLTFVAAGNIASLSDWRFDLAINTNSLGEMPVETAKAYVSWVHEHLVEGGHFFSKNGHNHEPDCIQFPHDYGFRAFKFVELGPTTAIMGLFDNFSHNAVLQKGLATSKYPEFYFDVLCSLYAVGLHDELIEISTNFAHEQLIAEQEHFLKVCDRFFSIKGFEEKLTYLEDSSVGAELEPCLNYLSGIVKYLTGDLKGSTTFLSEFLSSVRSFTAEAYAIMIMAKSDASILSSKFKFGARTQYALHEIASLFELRPGMRDVAWRLRSDILRKKITYPNNYAPSTLLKLKNVIFNAKEGRGLGAIR